MGLMKRHIGGFIPRHSDFVVWVGPGICTSPSCSQPLGLWLQLPLKQWVAGLGHRPRFQTPCGEMCFGCRGVGLYPDSSTSGDVVNKASNTQ